MFTSIKSYTLALAGERFCMKNNLLYLYLHYELQWNASDYSGFGHGLFANNLSAVDAGQPNC